MREGRAFGNNLGTAEELSYIEIYVCIYVYARSRWRMREAARFRAKREQLETLKGRSPESQGHMLIMTVFVCAMFTRQRPSVMSSSHG